MSDRGPASRGREAESARRRRPGAQVGPPPAPRASRTCRCRVQSTATRRPGDTCRARHSAARDSCATFLASSDRSEFPAPPRPRLSLAPKLTPLNFSRVSSAPLPVSCAGVEVYHNRLGGKQPSTVRWSAADAVVRDAGRASRRPPPRCSRRSSGACPT